MTSAAWYSGPWSGNGHAAGAAVAKGLSDKMSVVSQYLTGAFVFTIGNCYNPVCVCEG